MTRLGLYKDELDTTHRRLRHRDGRLLKGGIVLPTSGDEVIWRTKRCSRSAYTLAELDAGRQARTAVGEGRRCTRARRVRATGRVRSDGGA
jgi:hypothetical protein